MTDTNRNHPILDPDAPTWQDRATAQHDLAQARAGINQWASPVDQTDLAGCMSRHPAGKATAEVMHASWSGDSLTLAFHAFGRWQELRLDGRACQTLRDALSSDRGERL